MINTKDIKKDFSIFKTNPDLVFLDSAASSQTPDVVIDAMDEYYKNYRANIHRGLYKLSTTATNKYENVRKIAADFLGANTEEIIFTPGSTMAMNMLIYSIEQSINLNTGDEIVTTITEHHSTLIPLQEFSKRNKLTLKHIPINDKYELDYEKAKELITEKTKIVTLSLASNVLGTINDIKRITAMAREVGAIVIVDAAKSAGHIPIDVKDLDCDFLFLSGHKICGPTGIGVLYGKKKKLDTLRPSFFGGGIVNEVTKDDTAYNNSPTCFEAGTQNIAGVIGLGSALNYLTDMGIKNIHMHVSYVVDVAIKRLEKISGLTIYCQKDSEKNIGIVSFNVSGIHPHDVAEILSRENIAVRAGHHCAQPLMGALGIKTVVRASFFIYNDNEDVDRLVEAIIKAQKIFA